MGLYDRDYMREDTSTRSLPRIVAILSIVLSLVAATSYLLKELRLFTKTTSRPAVRTPSDHEKLLKISPIDLNTATHAELSLLPHVNEKMVTEIMASRPLLKIEDLDDVYGIGPKKLESIRPHVYVDAKTLKSRFPDAVVPKNESPQHDENRKSI